ncbi:MAG: CoA transferase, partial [Myxococcota bacterium]|nr:CoA transferase [Myxococcota bacterium]
MTTSSTALSTRRVVETGGGPSAYCGKLFADLGADVIKVEPPGGDRGRREAPLLEDGTQRSIPFLYLNANKRSVALDFDSPEGSSQFRALVDSCDILIDSHPTDFLEQRGLGYGA